MSENGPVLVRLYQNTGNDPEFMFHCPGCGYDHWFKTTGSEPKWTWNGDMKKPTVNPSIRVFGEDVERRCHFFIKDGKIEYCGDCHHHLRSQTVDMERVDH